MSDFYKTPMGKRHYKVVMPSIARALESIAASMERISLPIHEISVDDLDLEGLEDPEDVEVLSKALKAFKEKEKKNAVSADHIRQQVDLEMQAMLQEAADAHSKLNEDVLEKAKKRDAVKRAIETLERSDVLVPDIMHGLLEAWEDKLTTCKERVEELEEEKEK